MILWTLSNIRLSHEDYLVIVYDPNFLNKQIFEGIVRQGCPRAQFSYLKTISKGPIQTLACGLRAIPREKLARPTMCLDGDGYYSFDVTASYRAFAASGQGGVVSYRDVQPKPIYSYVKADSKGSITAIAEKRKISDWANTGTYCFPSGKTLLDYIMRAIESEENAKNGDDPYGLYTSKVIAQMLRDGREFKLITLQARQFFSLGSPDLIKEFAKTQTGTFKKKRFCFDLENTLVTAPTVPGDYRTCRPIKRNVEFARSLSRMGHTIIVQSSLQETSLAKQGFHQVIQMMEDLGIPHDDVHFGKPAADFYIDDEAVYSGNDLSKELGFYDVGEARRTGGANESGGEQDAKQMKSNTPATTSKASKKVSTNVALAQHMRKCTIGDEDVYMNASTGLPIFRVTKISTFLLFDLDGTIVATDPVYLATFRQILKPYGYNVTQRFFEENIHGRCDQDIFQELLPKEMSNADKKKIIQQKLSVFRNKLFAAKLQPMAGLLSFLDWAEKNSIRSACVTNSDRATAEAVLSALDLRRRMDVLIIGGECARSKPYPDPYIAAMTRLGARADDCIVFEDSRSGVQSAVASKARLVIGVRSSLSDHVLVRHGANATINDFTEATPALFNQLHSSLLSSEVEERLLVALREKGFPVKGVSSARQLPGGNISQCLRVIVQYVDDEDECPYPTSMILKMEYRDTEVKSDMTSALRLYEREWSFYGRVGRQVATRIPRLYARLTDTKGRAFGVVLEDLDCVQGVVVKKSLSIREGKLVIKELARLHSQFWGAVPDTVRRPNHESYDQVQGILQSRFARFKEIWGKQLLDENMVSADIIMHHYAWIRQQMSLPPYTLCHGDVSTRNLFFMSEMGDTPALIDWQQVSASKGISDLAYFVLSSFPLEEQAAVESQLVVEYHRALQMNGVYGYSLKQCWLDYRMSMMFIPFVVAIWYGSSPRCEMVDPDFPYHITQATFAAIERNRSTSLLPEYFSMNLVHRCKKALIKSGYPVKNLIIDAKKLKGGYICETLRLQIEYDDGAGSDTGERKRPRSCVLKAEAPGSSDHQTALNLHLYDREWHFYQTMSSLVPVRVPEFYGAVERADGKGDICGVLMENLMIPGAQLCPKLDMNGIFNLVNHAAKLHAKFWNDANLDKLGVHRLNGSWFQPSWEQKIAGHWPEFKKKWATVLTSKDIAAGEKIVRNFRVIQNHLGSAPYTFLHGDVKPANMFLLKGNVPAFIDWQYTKIGKGVCDIVFFIIEGYPEAKQREIEGKVREHYRQCLAAHGVKGYTREMCERDWAFACMYFPIYVCMWFGTVPDEDLVDEMFPRRIIPRTFDAIRRNNAASYLPDTE